MNRSGFGSPMNNSNGSCKATANNIENNFIEHQVSHQFMLNTAFKERLLLNNSQTNCIMKQLLATASEIEVWYV